MNVVIPYRSDYPDLDLKYCLRGIDLYIPGAQVFIVGDLPRTVTNVTHIPVKDDAGYKWASRNIYRKLKAAAERLDHFLVVHDDHFLLRESCFNWPYYHKGDMMIRDKPGGYKILIANTLVRFGQVHDYEKHGPIWIEANKLSKLNSLDWNTEYGYGIQTAYCVMNDLHGHYYPDLKIKTAMSKDDILKAIEGRPWFSTGSGSYQGDIKKVFKELYKKKSVYEV